MVYPSVQQGQPYLDMVVTLAMGLGSLCKQLHEATYRTSSCLNMPEIPSQEKNKKLKTLGSSQKHKIDPKECGLNFSIMHRPWEVGHQKQPTIRLLGALHYY
uniref:Uncharacterized protein n=1 Tax=Opuntia streptacantha TaxID=393608 RepID=A0A7C9ALM1_OPUST